MADTPAPASGKAPRRGAPAGAENEPAAAPPPAPRLAAVGLIVLMVIGSLLLWIGAPVFWIWLGSQLQQGSQPSLGPYMIVLVGVVISMAILAKLLSQLDRAYGRVTRSDAKVHVQLPWLRSMRGERASKRPTRVIDIVMVASVAIAMTALGVWFFLLAGSSLPH